MKNMKKLFSLLLALVMVMGLAVSASAASITIISPDADDGTDSGATYAAYKIFDAKINGDKVAYTIDSSSPYFATIQAATNYFTLTQVGETTTYTVTVLDAYDNNAAKTFAETLKNVTATSSGTVDGNVISNLDEGYYLVTSSVGSALVLDTLGDITINSKNSYPSLDKKVEGRDSTTADMGEVLTFTIDVTIPATATGEIVVHDKMTGLEYQSMTAVDGITVVTSGLSDGCAVHFTLTAAYVAANKGTTVTITYTAKVTADVANNKAWLVDDTFTSKPDDTDVYSTDLVINKYDGSDDTKKLAGAVFVLKNADGTFYQVDADGNVSWVDSQDAATKMTTDDKGAAEFTNIADGTYNLVEITAPTGYNLLTAPVEVKVEAKLDNVGAVIDITADVANNSGSELPSTGGMGTTMFYAVGGMLVLAAVILLVTKRRMSAEQ